MRHGLILGALLLATTGVVPRAARCQQSGATIRVAIGFGVDTARSPNREILDLYRTYLSQLPDTARTNPYWSRTEQERWPLFDLLSGYLYQGFTHFTVVHLAPAVGLDRTYLIRTLISTVSDSTRAVRPLALYRVYAVREAGRWVLANALPRMTRTWRRERIDSITFVFPPTQGFVRARAEATARFADSLAHAFDVPVPAITYYFTDDLIETFRAMGLDFFPLGSDTLGGRANAVDHQVFVGASGVGEGYRHEVAHIVLQPLIDRRTAGLVMEGLMTWTGGSAGLGFRELLPGLAAYVGSHPGLTLAEILHAPPARVGSLDVGYDGFALLCDMIHAAGGRAALEEWLHAGRTPEAVLGTAARLLHVHADQLDALWRRQLTRMSTR